MAKRDIISVAVLSLGFLGVVGGGGYYYLTTRPPDPMQVAEEHAVAARRSLNQANWQIAVQEASAALEIDPDLYATNRVRGEARFRLNDAPGAIRDLTAAIDNGFDDAETILLRAKAYRDDDRIERAQAEFARVAELDPKNREVRGVSGKLLLDLGRYDEARIMLESQLKLVPADAASWRHLAWSLWGLGRYEEAIDPFGRAMEELPDNYHGWYGRGISRLFAGDLEGAISDLDALCTDPEFTTDYPHFFLFLARQRVGEVDAAVAALQRHKTDHVNQRHRDDWIGTITQFLLGELTEPEFLERISETGTTPDPLIAVEGWYFAGMMRLLSGDHDGGVAMLKQVVDTRVYSYYEYHAAVAELRALGLFDESLVNDAIPDH